jgi:hypothetical protein
MRARFLAARSVVRVFIAANTPASPGRCAAPVSASNRERAVAAVSSKKVSVCSATCFRCSSRT